MADTTHTPDGPPDRSVGRLPTTIGRYRVTGLVGTGGFAAVYRAVDERIGADVAIKLLADHHSLDPDIRERFIHEARLLRRVNSPHVVRLYDLDETERRQPFLVLEFVAGGNLEAHRLRLLEATGRRVRREDVTTVARGVAAALQTLHAERIVHRDLSPTNLLVRRRNVDGDGPAAVSGFFGIDDELVLADLGLSKDLAASSGLTAAAGTYGFAAPEQRVAGIIDERADVYAASALLTWFVLGHEPAADDRAELAAAGWPPAFADLLAHGLAAERTDRPPNIDVWHDGVTSALGVDEPSTDPPVPADVPRRRRRAVALAGALAVGAACGVGGAQLLGGDDDSATTEIVELGDGNIRASTNDDGIESTFEGPATLTVGDTATYRAVSDGASWVWYDEAFTPVTGARTMTATPRSEGVFTLRLATMTPDGVAVATAEIPVLAADDVDPSGGSAPASSILDG